MTNVSNVASTVGPGATMQEPFSPRVAPSVLYNHTKYNFYKSVLKADFHRFSLTGLGRKEGWERSESPANYRTPGLCYGTEILRINSTSIDVVFAFLMK